MKRTICVAMLLLVGAGNVSRVGMAGGQTLGVQRLELMKVGDEEGVASWYDWDGRVMANGQVMDSTEMICAHRTLPFGSKVLVTNVENENSVEMVVKDRGPFFDESMRILDVSKGAADVLGFVETGLAKVRIEVLEKGDGKRFRRPRKHHG